jgi:hypothetical protein
MLPEIRISASYIQMADVSIKEQACGLYKRGSLRIVLGTWNLDLREK